MSLLKLHRADDYWFFDADECREAGKSRMSQYAVAQPFPHIVLDDFLPTEFLLQIASTYPELEGHRFFDRDQERYKYQFGPEKLSSGPARNLLAELNGAAFLGFLEELTGITGLISDPYLSGGGLHLTRRGGHLGVHADFNVHGQMKVERRLNLLIYLNQDWEDSFGGALELWERDMSACSVKVAPVLGRAVIFSTMSDSFHGHPDPLQCPDGRDRRSIATYYYTAFESAGPKPHTTLFKPRPETGDKTDWAVLSDQFIGDWVPRRLQKIARRLNPMAR